MGLEESDTWRLENTHREKYVRHILLHGLGVRNPVNRLVHTNTFSRQDGLVNTKASGRDGE